MRDVYLFKFILATRCMMCFLMCTDRIESYYFSAIWIFLILATRDLPEKNIPELPDVVRHSRSAVTT